MARTIRITVGELRRLVREAYFANVPYGTPEEPFVPIARKARGSSESKDEELPEHLQDPDESVEDAEGPVPRDKRGMNVPQATFDPLVRGWSVIGGGR